MFHFYFNTTIPNITDWIQSFGVLIAAIGLIITFRLQRKATLAQIIATNAQVKATEDQALATKSQLEVAERDYQRYIVELEPKIVFFELSFDEINNTGKLKARIEANAAFDVCFDYKNKDSIYIDEIDDIPIDLQVDTCIDFNFKILNPHEFFSNQDPHKQLFSIATVYSDKLHNKYKQTTAVFPKQSEIVYMVPRLVK
jgi:hypothetical protein